VNPQVVMKPKFLVWAMAVALNYACPPVLVAVKDGNRVVVRSYAV